MIPMRYKIALLSLAFVVSTQPGFAQDSIVAKKAEPSKMRPYNEVITSKAVSKAGLFTVSKVDEKYYFEIPDSLLKREFLFTTRLVKVPTGSPMFGGELVNNIIVKFEKAGDDKLYLRVMTNVAVADSSNAIAKAVRNSTIDPIIMVIDVKAKGKTNESSVVDVTDFILKDNNITGFDLAAKKNMYLGASAADRSFILSANAFQQNVEVKTVKTFSLGAAPKPAEPGAEASGPAASASVTMELSNSIMLLPAQQMAARHADPRVGYYTENYKIFSDDQQKVKENNFIVRQKLEPKTEDIERYKRGELVEPKEPIVYYVDPATPKQWRPYIIAGINDWNEAFKAAGFKNAIFGKEWPENDTTMSLEDARYKIIRYFPSEVANAYGPNIHDPRSGEVLQSYVGWYHNVMTLLHDWYMVQAAPNDPRAREMKFSDSLMGTLIRFVSSHEVGHTLGLRHNMGSSSLTPVENLRNKKWVEANGHTASIMDYARFNYVAQPEDSISEAGIMPRINDYDKWAIKWGYTYTGEGSDQVDRKIITKWIVDSLKANPRLWFGGEGMNNDARCQSEDVGDNSVKASEYGIKNLKYVMKHLPEWTKEENDLYSNNLQNMYIQVVTQYLRYVRHVAANIGSVYETYKTVEQPGDIYTSAPKAKQKEAVAFFQKEVFTTPEWMLDNNILNKISSPVRAGSVSRAQATALDLMLNDRVLMSMHKMEDRFGKQNVYTLVEYLDDVKAIVWQELKTGKPTDMFRRAIQKNYVANLLASMNEAEEGKNSIGMLLGISELQLPITTGSDLGSYLAMHLQNLRSEILKDIPKCKDKETRDHLKYVANQIKTGLDKQFDHAVKGIE